MSETTSLEVFTINNFFLFWQAVFLSWVLKAIFLKKKRKNADGVSFFIFWGLASGIVFFSYFMRGPMALAYILSSAALLAPSCLGLTLVADFLDDKCIYCNTCCCSSWSESSDQFGDLCVNSPSLHTSSVLVVSGLMALGRKRKGEGGGVEM